jgi:hypothetical protein
MKTLKQLLANKNPPAGGCCPQRHGLSRPDRHGTSTRSARCWFWMANNWSASFPNATMPGKSSCRARHPRKRWFGNHERPCGLRDPDLTLQECMALMTEKRFRHLPVLDDDGECRRHDLDRRLVKETISDQQFLIDQLERYIAG